MSISLQYILFRYITLHTYCTYICEKRSDILVWPISQETWLISGWNGVLYHISSQTHVFHYLAPSTWRVNQEHLACFCSKVDGVEMIGGISWQWNVFFSQVKSCRMWLTTVNSVHKLMVNPCKSIIIGNGPKKYWIEETSDSGIPLSFRNIFPGLYSIHR